RYATDFTRQVDAAKRVDMGCTDLHTIHFRRQIRLITLFFSRPLFRIVPDLSQPAMYTPRMETIRRRLLTGRFPVCIDDETLWPPENLHALIATQEKHVVVPLGITEKLIKRRAIDIPGSEDQTAVERHPGFLQAQLL